MDYYSDTKLLKEDSVEDPNLHFSSPARPAAAAAAGPRVGA
jgi:hypothetical protein